MTDPRTIGTAPVLVFDALPWWIVTPLLYLGLVSLGIALEETCVNRTTVLAGALALAVSSATGGGLRFPVALYLDIGLVVGAYGRYAYVIDGYVSGWFRVLAYFVYSPLSVVLVIPFPDVLFVVALSIAAVANGRLLAALHPLDPYYFGPESEEVFVEAAETGEPEPLEGGGATPGGGITSAVTGSIL
ncbi:hypothetical protein [Halovivax sp.]|uniref:hypothetical protein n=1 Tax=Halovivax sp. TaxID=1935978 RepID=UPI0025BB9855|nr:hypothetical protein [Halovivax sp.]